MDNEAFISVHKSIEKIIENGGSVLYNQYLNEKMPMRIHQNQTQLINTNMNLHFQKLPQKHILSNLSNRLAQNCTKDTMVCKSIPINQELFKPQESNQSNNQIMNTQTQNKINYKKNSRQNGKRFIMQNQKSTFNPQQSCQKALSPERPFSMISNRKEIRKMNSKLINNRQTVEDKRASTSMNMRKQYKHNKQSVNQNLIGLAKEEDLTFAQEQHSSLKKYKIQNNFRTIEIENERRIFQQNRNNQLKRAKQRYQKLKSKLSSKLHQEVLHFQSIDGQININNNIKASNRQPIVQIKYKKHPEQQYSTLQPEKISVKKFRNRCLRGQEGKKCFQVGRRKRLVSNSDYNNNGIRQVSSIPYVNVSEGVQICQTGGMVISAIRRRSKDEVNKSKYDEMNQTGFKSFNRTIHSRKISQDIQSNMSLNISQGKDQDSKQNTNRSIENSILWNPKKLPENKYIRISNNRYFNNQILNN